MTLQEWWGGACGFAPGGFRAPANERLEQYLPKQIELTRILIPFGFLTESSLGLCPAASKHTKEGHDPPKTATLVFCKPQKGSVITAQ